MSGFFAMMFMIAVIGLMMMAAVTIMMGIGQIMLNPYILTAILLISFVGTLVTI